MLTPAEMGEHPQFRERGVIAVDDDGELRVCFPAGFSEHPARRPGPSPEPDADRDAWSDRADDADRPEVAMAERPIFDGINLVVDDMDAAVAFYRRLGVEVPDECRHVGCRITGTRTPERDRLRSRQRDVRAPVGRGLARRARARCHRLPGRVAR